MKRHQSLETLSFEHHDALVVALRLKKGLAKNASLQTMADYALSLYRHHLIHHFDQEEQTLVEPLKPHKEARLLVQRMLNEHKRFAGLAGKLKADEKEKKAALKEFAELLNDHVRFEERELFTAAENLLSAEQLASISVYLHRAHVAIDKNWPVAFWQE